MEKKLLCPFCKKEPGTDKKYYETLSEHVMDPNTPRVKRLVYQCDCEDSGNMFWTLNGESYGCAKKKWNYLFKFKKLSYFMNYKDQLLNSRMRKFYRREYILKSLHLNKIVDTYYRFKYRIYKSFHRGSNSIW